MATYREYFRRVHVWIDTETHVLLDFMINGEIR